MDQTNDQSNASTTVPITRQHPFSPERLQVRAGHPVPELIVAPRRADRAFLGLVLPLHGPVLLQRVRL